ncbi:MAG: D-alanyl-D-alanine carboxypeptidase [Parcubacteria group bacterium]|nr:D-alanyl-D-alanine carboxypeptidase [Parcubacteria group bacterium]
MSFLSVVAAIASLLWSAFPIAERGAYVSGGGVRADRLLSIADAPPPPVKVDIASLGPRMSAKSAIVVDASSGAVLFEKNAGERRPIASIAKLAAALVFLDDKPNLEALFAMEASDDRAGAEEFIRPGESAKLRDFLVASLLGSANNATITLARATNSDLGAFVERMNQKARDIGMRDTVFTEPSGLAPENVSTARDVVKLLAEAGTHEAITGIIGTHRATITVHPKGVRKIVLTTNHLMGSIVPVAYGKTGHLDESGYNLAAAVETRGGRMIYVVTLGSETNEDRVQDAKNLAVWAGNTYAWE